MLRRKGVIFVFKALFSVQCVSRSMSWFLPFVKSPLCAQLMPILRPFWRGNKRGFGGFLIFFGVCSKCTVKWREGWLWYLCNVFKGKDINNKWTPNQYEDIFSIFFIADICFLFNIFLLLTYLATLTNEMNYDIEPEIFWTINDAILEINGIGSNITFIRFIWCQIWIQLGATQIIKCIKNWILQSKPALTNSFEQTAPRSVKPSRG